MLGAPPPPPHLVLCGGDGSGLQGSVHTGKRPPPEPRAQLSGTHSVLRSGFSSCYSLGHVDRLKLTVLPLAESLFARLAGVWNPSLARLEPSSTLPGDTAQSYLTQGLSQGDHWDVGSLHHHLRLELWSLDTTWPLLSGLCLPSLLHRSVQIWTLC